MQQQQLAAQLAHHGGRAPPPLSPAPQTSDSDSDISLGAHSPPMGSPGPLRFGATSPTPLSSFRFGPHSPGPMPTQFRFGNLTPIFRMDRQSSPPSFMSHKIRSESPVETATNYSRLNDESPIVVDTTDIKDNSPQQTNLQHSPPMNLRISDNIRGNNDDITNLRMPEPLRMNNSPVTAPLRIHVSNRLPQQTALQIGTSAHGGIVRIAPQSPNNAPILHRPFSPPRLT